MIFKPLKFTGGMYHVSDTGIIKSYKRKKDIILKPFLSDYGYLTCVLCFDGIKKNFNIHQLVAIAFLDHIPNGMNMIVDHIDDNKLNNNVSNLRIISQAENITKWRDEKKSKYEGVYPHLRSGKWISRIKIDKKVIHLGLFEKEKDANNMFNIAKDNLFYYSGDNKLFRSILISKIN